MIFEHIDYYGNYIILLKLHNIHGNIRYEKTNSEEQWCHHFSFKRYYIKTPTGTRGWVILSENALIQKCTFTCFRVGEKER